MKATKNVATGESIHWEDMCMFGVPNEAAVAGGTEYRGKQVARLVSLNHICSLHCLGQIAGPDRPLVWHSAAFLMFMKISVMLCKPIWLMS